MAMLDRVHADRPMAETLALRARQVSTIAATHAAYVDQAGRFPAEALAAMREARLLGAMAPVELGGEGATFREIAEAITLIGQGCSSAGMVFAMHQIKVESLINHALGSSWHRDFLKRLTANQLLLASATSEAGIGGDLRNSVCALVPDGDHVSIDKDATVISYARNADAYLATARRTPEAQSSDQMMVVIERDQASLVQTSVWDTLGMRGTASEGFKLSARVPAAQVIPAPFSEIAAQSMLASSHLFWASLWFGIAASALSRAQAHVRAGARKAPAMAAGSTAQRLAKAAGELSGLKALVRDGIARFETARDDGEAIQSMGFAVAMNAVKLAASERAVAIVQEALAVTGLAGYRNDSPVSVGRQLRDILSAPLMIGNDRIAGNTATMLLVSRLDTDLEG